MDEFYTAETMMEIWNNQFEDERTQALLDTYDPYSDYDYDNECPSCGGTDECVCEVDEGDEDRGFEGYLFGWDA